MYNFKKPRQDSNKLKIKFSSLNSFLETIDIYLSCVEKCHQLQELKIDYITFRHILESNQEQFGPSDTYREYNIII